MNTDSSCAWLKDLADGDKVIVIQPTSVPPKVVGIVRLTKTQIVVKAPAYEGYQCRFRRDTGRQIGECDYYAYHFLRPYTVEAHAAIRAYSAQRKLFNAMHAARFEMFHKLTQEECERLLALLSEHGLSQQTGGGQE